MSVLSVLAPGLLLACPASQPPQSNGCTKDTECKRDRVCFDGACVDPATSDASDAERPVGSTGAGAETWRRGGPGAGRPSPYAGPAVSPVEVWDVSLGTVVFATAAIGPGPQGPTAFVGTHGGRFVGVTIGGEKAGEIVLDLQLAGRMWASPAVAADGIVYVGDDDDRLYAIDPMKGSTEEAIRWKIELGDCAETRAPGPEGARCDVDGGPTIGFDGELYVGADGVYRISPKGEVVWHWPSPQTAPAPAPAPAPEKSTKKGSQSEAPKSSALDQGPHVFSAPVVTKSKRVYFGSQDGYVTSLDAETGVERWRYHVRADVDGSGVIDEDGAVIVGADDGRVFALRSDGSLRWSFVAQRDIRSGMSTGPGDSLYATSFDGNLYSLTHAGEVQWVLPTGGIVHSSPVVDRNGMIFFGSQDDHLYAVSGTGKVAWTVEFPGDVDASVALAEDGTLIVGCDDGHLRAFRSKD